MSETIAGMDYSRVVPINVRYVARVEVDLSYLRTDADDAQIREDVRHELRGGLAELASARAEEVLIEAVWIYRETETDFHRVYEAVWGADPSRPVELHGGHADGQVLDFRRRPDGWPEPIIRVPVPQGVGFDADDVYPTGGARIAHYELFGFNPAEVRWAYRLVTR